MTELRIALLLVLGTIALLPNGSNGQLEGFPWEMGTQPFGVGCSQTGVDLGLGISDPWIINAHCQTHGGNVGCINSVCTCNQEDDAYYVFDDNTWIGGCFGKVGAYCTAEKSSLFPDKPCTPNADCVPLQDGAGRILGECKCLYGYKTAENGTCIIDDSVGDGDRATPRTTTTTEAPKREQLQLPLQLLLANTFVGFNETCKPKGTLLNHTYCDTHSRTVSCQNSECLCNMQEDSVFDKELNMCVGLTGTWCLAKLGLLLGPKTCVKNAICELEANTTLEEGYLFGTCACDYGYKDDVNNVGHCVRDESIPLPTTTPSTTTTKRGNGNGAETKSPAVFFGVLTVFMCITYQFIMN